MRRFFFKLEENAEGQVFSQTNSVERKIRHNQQLWPLAGLASPCAEETNDLRCIWHARTASCVDSCSDKVSLGMPALQDSWIRKRFCLKAKLCKLFFGQTKKRIKQKENDGKNLRTLPSDLTAVIIIVGSVSRKHFSCAWSCRACRRT